MSSKKFDTFVAFREWANLQPGDTLTFPASDLSDKWLFVVRDSTTDIDSPWYLGRFVAPHGALKSDGINFQFGGQEVSGVVEFGLNDDGEVVVTNRRRVTSQDVFDEVAQYFVGVIIAQPDRVLEKVAVVVNKTAIDQARSLTAEQRLSLYGRVRDSLELQAVREFFRWVDAK